ncbi:hypothetical protein H2248_005895 [Termitomyces sp. 'cryptogamus']|nr:hypothetical protein H2248_005895 [Termitomyces sp. 'cryptogamus']
MGTVLGVGGMSAGWRLSESLHVPKSSKEQVIWEDDIENLPAVMFPANVPLAANAGSIHFLPEQTVDMPHASYPVFVPDADNCPDKEVEGRVHTSWIEPVTGAWVYPEGDSEDEVAAAMSNNESSEAHDMKKETRQKKLAEEEAHQKETLMEEATGQIPAELDVIRHSDGRVDHLNLFFSGGLGRHSKPV